MRKAERNGYVTIEGADEKRGYTVKLTEEGEKLAEKRCAAQAQTADDILSCLTDGRSLMNALTEKIISPPRIRVLMAAASTARSIITAIVSAAVANRRSFIEAKSHALVVVLQEKNCRWFFFAYRQKACHVAAAALTKARRAGVTVSA